MPMLSEDDLNLAELIDDELGRGISGSAWRQATNEWTRRIRMGCLWARSLTQRQWCPETGRTTRIPKTL